MAGGSQPDGRAFHSLGGRCNQFCQSSKVIHPDAELVQIHIPLLSCSLRRPSAPFNAMLHESSDQGWAIKPSLAQAPRPWFIAAACSVISLYNRCRSCSYVEIALLLNESTMQVACCLCPTRISERQLLILAANKAKSSI